MIVKCQLSLSTTEPVSQLLFYNRARDWEWMGDATPEWAERFSPSFDGHKFFAEVRWRNRHQPPEFVKRLPDQSW